MSHVLDCRLMEGLEQFAHVVAAHLCEEPRHKVVYPENCNSDNWSSQVVAIRNLNQTTFEQSKSAGNLYGIFVRDGSSWEFRYVGKSKSDALESRLKQHFVSKGNDDNNTSSKLSEVKNEVSAGREVGFSYVDVGPGEELCVYVEAWIQNHRNPEWNKRKEARNRSTRS